MIVPVVIRDGDGERDVLVDITDADATVAELLAALDVAARDTITVDGFAVRATTAVARSPLLRGAVIDVRAGARDARPADAASAPAGYGSSFSRSDGRLVWRRRPRAMPVAGAPPPAAPAPPADPMPPARPGMVTLVVPLLIAGLIATLWNPMFAVFALIAPLVSLATWVEGRRRHRAEVAVNRHAHARARLRWQVGARDHSRRLVARLRASHPDPEELSSWPAGGHPRLWERRRHHDDFMVLRIATRHRDVPVTLRIDGGAIVGLVGEREHATAAARAVLAQIVAHHGPADCRIGLVTTDTIPWDWVKWLPHVARIGGSAIVSSVEDVAESGCDLVVADAAAAAARPHALAGLVGEGMRVLVVAEGAAALPGATTCVVDAEAGVVSVPATGERLTGCSVGSLDIGTATGLARQLARYADPEETASDGAIPDEVRLAELLEGDVTDAASVALTWKTSAAANVWLAPVGVAAGGPVILDLVRDGPHALVAGTTGAGKSEFLRSLVASLAAAVDPVRLNFVLVDYKGGSAFDACARFPHTVGVVTDLDEGLAERALICLEAELGHRERRFREIGVAGIDDLCAGDAEDPIPRLVIVVDEFAALATELPDFMARLVDIAQRGRSLGVHLVLATQRPAGVVNDMIRANTNLRVALRVQTAADSVDVVGMAGAAGLDRLRPGRAILRVGQDEAVRFQAALVSGAGRRREPIEVRSFDAVAGTVVELPRSEGPADLDRLVAAIAEASATAGHHPPRRPWPDPLPERLHRHDLPATGLRGAAYGLCDDPAQQRSFVATWSPDDGSLLLYGLAGSGTTTALKAVVLGLAGLEEPPDVYVVDCDDQELGPLETLPYVGAVIGAADIERQTRVLRFVADLIDERRRSPERGRRVVLVIDGFEALLANFAHEVDGEVATLLMRIAADGPGIGVVLVASAKQPSGIPHRIASLCPARLVFRMVDRFDYRSVGCDRHLVDPPPGRALSGTTGLEIQVAMCSRDDIEQVAVFAAGRVAPPVETLPDRVAAESLPSASCEGGDWVIPLGLDERRGEPAVLVLRPGEDVLIAGRRGTGRTTALVTVGHAVARGGGRVLAVSGGASSPLGRVGEFETIPPDPDDIVEMLRLPLDDGPDFLLVDDAERIDSPELNEAIAAAGRTLRVVAAADVVRLRGRYGHWTEEVRRSGTGLLLCPERADGDLLGVHLPARTPETAPPGRGLLVVGGSTAGVQVAITA